MVFLSAPRIRRIVMAAFLIVAAALSLAGLNLVRQSLGGRLFQPALLLALLPFAIWSFGLRALRWYVLVRSIKPSVSPVTTSYVQLVGFSFSVTPGRVAELYKLKVLERLSGIPVARSLPAVVVERLTDAVALGLLIALGGILHWSSTASPGSMVPLVAATVGLVVLALVFLLSPGRSIRSAWRGGLPSWVPFRARIAHFLASERIATILAQLADGGTGVTRPATLALALALVFVGRLADGVILWKISQAIGHPIPLSLAMLIMGTTALVGGMSLAPGGLGAAEAALVALIVAQGIPLALAVGAAFTARTLLFWLWVVLGLGVFGVSHGYALFNSLRSRDSFGSSRLRLLTKRTLEREG